MLTHPYRLLLGASLAVCVGAAAAQNAPDSSSRLPAAKGTINTMPAQPSQQPTDKMSGDTNAAASQGTATTQNTAQPAQSAPMHHAHKSASRQREAVTPEEKSYRDALRQCAKERDESQRDSCLDSAIEQHPNG